MNKFSIISLSILITIFTIILWIASQQTYGDTIVPILSGILGFLLKALSDSITISQQRQWQLEDFTREQTLKYFEAKLNEMSLFLISETEMLSRFIWKHEKGKLRLEDNVEITREWLKSSATVRTVTKILNYPEINECYKRTFHYVESLGNFTMDLNNGKLDHLGQDEIKERLKKDIEEYHREIKKFQLTLEVVRVKVLRGELSLNN